MDSGFVSIKTLVILVVGALFGVFVLQNSATVDIQFLLWRATMSRVVMLFAALAVGFLIGILAGWEVFGKKKERGKTP